MIVQIMVAVVLVLFAMLLSIRLVRIAANLVVILLCGCGCGFAVFHILEGIWNGWRQVVVYSLATGVAVAMLSLPVLPFCRFKED